MKVLVISQSEVSRLLPMSECIAQMELIFQSLHSGDAVMPLRQVIWLPGNKSALAAMPSYWGTKSVTGIKVITVFPGNALVGLDSHQGAILLFETGNGRLLAVIDATEVTAIRTAAVSGLATRILARTDASELAILGAGVQARTHLAAMLTVRNIRKVRVWNRTPQNAQDFCKWANSRFNIDIELSKAADDAISASDIVCTTTSSRNPIMSGKSVRPGTHLNVIGAYGPDSREIDTETVVRSRFFVDRRESAWNEAGDFLIPLREGVITENHILGEMSDLVSGSVPGRISTDDVTVFKSMGLAVEDLAAAQYLYQKAIELKTGTYVELGGNPGGSAQ